VDMSTKFDFDLQMPFEKATTEDGRWILKGVAAGTGIDLQNERLAPELVSKFAEQISKAPVPFLNWHNENDALAEMGEVTKAWVTPNFDLGVEVELDQDDYRAQKLWRKLDQGKQFGMSVAGKVHEYKDEYEKSAGRVRTYYDATLKEVSLTTKPIYTPSFGTVLKKAADAASEGDMSTNVETPNATETVVEEKRVEQTVVAPASEPQVSEPETPAVEEKVVEKAMPTTDKARAKTIKQIVGMHRDMSRLIAELVLSEEDGTASADSVVTEAVVTTKSETTAEGEDQLQKAVDEITRLSAEIGELKARIPATPAPEVLVKKSDEEEAAELFKSLSTSDRLRLALAVTHNGK
jgi:phage head maturation protease